MKRKKWELLSYTERARIKFNQFDSFLTVTEMELADWSPELTDKELVRLSTLVDRVQDCLDGMVTYRRKG